MSEEEVISNKEIKDEVSKKEILNENKLKSIESNIEPKTNINDNLDDKNKVDNNDIKKLDNETLVKNQIIIQINDEDYNPKKEDCFDEKKDKNLFKNDCSLSSTQNESKKTDELDNLNENKLEFRHKNNSDSSNSSCGSNTPLSYNNIPEESSTNTDIFVSCKSIKELWSNSHLPMVSFKIHQNNQDNDSNKKTNSNNLKNFVLAESRFKIQSSSDKQQTEPPTSPQSSNTSVKFRPSFLKLGDNCSSNDISTSDDNSNSQIASTNESSIKVSSDGNSFKFTPLTHSPTSKCTNLKNKSSETSTSKPFTFTSNLFKSNNNNSNSEEENVFSENLFNIDTSTKNDNETSSFSVSNNSGSSFGFIFGQNLSERVINVVPSSEKTNSQPLNSNNQTSPKKLIIQEKRKYENITGEEDENNIMQIYCKLYSWDSSSSSWKEKGKGNLRLNEKLNENGKTCSRIIMRTSGSLKVILNCLIVKGMKFELNNECLRFSNVDGIHLIKAKLNDIEQLYKCIISRLKLFKRIKFENESSDNYKDEENDNIVDKNEDNTNENLQDSNV